MWCSAKLYQYSNVSCYSQKNMLDITAILSCMNDNVIKRNTKYDFVMEMNNILMGVSKKLNKKHKR